MNNHAAVMPLSESPSMNPGTETVGELVEWIRGRGKILIVGHDNPDPDSIAAAVALRHLFLIKTGQDAVLAYGGVIGRSENREMVELLEIPLVPLGDLDLNQFAITCMVDTQPHAGNNSLPDDHPVQVIIDHHLQKKDHGDVFWFDVREEYGASATILYEYLNDQDVSINTRLATSLFYAIKSETQDLGREWSKADREAYLKLLPLSNNRILSDIINPPVPRDYFSAFRKAIDNAWVYGEVLVFNLYEISNPDLVAELADFLLRQHGVEYVLGMGWYQGTQILSMRSSQPEARLGTIIQEMVEGVGTAGGHGMIAGGQIRDMAGDEASQQQLEDLLVDRMFASLRIKKPAGEPLIID